MSYPKYQYSIFLKGAKDEQLVIRADDWDEFIELKKNADAIITKVEKVEDKPHLKAKCKECGEDMIYKTGLSKTNKPWKGLFCPNREHPPIWL